ncbi:hypothetical protein CTI14_50845, partial [Methylobacterium radiotolerans]
NKPHAMSGLLLDADGTPSANAAGNEGSYRAVLDFLAQARRTRVGRLGVTAGGSPRPGSSVSLPA